MTTSTSLLRHSRVATRNPQRAQERILTAAMTEFSAKGLAGVRVDSIANLRRGQARGLLPRDLDPRQLLLAIISLTTFPLAFPQITRLVTGLPVADPEFRKRRVAFLQQLTTAFRPKGKSA